MVAHHQMHDAYSPGGQGPARPPDAHRPALGPAGRFDVALVCANGHLLNDLAASDPGLNAKFCPYCGEGTLSTCPECDTPIRGRLHGAGPSAGVAPGPPSGDAQARATDAAGQRASAAPVGPNPAWWPDPGPVLPPRYCHECGEPFPWTAERLRAADELTEQLDELSDEERRLLKAGFRDILTDNPRTEVAALRVKRIAEGAGRSAGQVLLEVAEHLATETARRLIFGA